MIDFKDSVSALTAIIVTGIVAYNFIVFRAMRYEREQLEIKKLKMEVSQLENRVDLFSIEYNRSSSGESPTENEQRATPSQPEEPSGEAESVKGLPAFVAHVAVTVITAIVAVTTSVFALMAYSQSPGKASIGILLAGTSAAFALIRIKQLSQTKVRRAGVD